jgi:hypothetical protein
MHARDRTIKGLCSTELRAIIYILSIVVQNVPFQEKKWIIWRKIGIITLKEPDLAD